MTEQEQNDLITYCLEKRLKELIQAIKIEVLAWLTDPAFKQKDWSHEELSGLKKSLERIVDQDKQKQMAAIGDVIKHMMSKTGADEIEDSIDRPGN